LDLIQKDDKKDVSEILDNFFKNHLEIRKNPEGMMEMAPFPHYNKPLFKILDAYYTNLYKQDDLEEEGSYEEEEEHPLILLARE
jgi:hypothetical protein